MSRYIDAEWLKIALELYRVVDLSEAPSIDIVRCKECKWFDADNVGDDYCRWVKGLCDCTADSFCSYGERKTDD